MGDDSPLKVWMSSSTAAEMFYSFEHDLWLTLGAMQITNPAACLMASYLTARSSVKTGTKEILRKLKQ